MQNLTRTPPEPDPEDIRIGATIRQMREMRGMTQEQLSRSCILSRAYVANIEAGRKRPSTKAVARLAVALQVPQIAIMATAPAESA